MGYDFTRIDYNSTEWTAPPKTPYKLTDLTDEYMTAQGSPHKWSELPPQVHIAFLSFLNGECCLNETLRRCFQDDKYYKYSQPRTLRQILSHQYALQIHCEYELIVNNGVDQTFESIHKLVNSLGTERGKSKNQTKCEINLYCTMDEQGWSCWTGGKMDYNIMHNGTIYHGANKQYLCEQVGLSPKLYDLYVHYDEMGLSFRRFWEIFCEETNWHRISMDITETLGKDPYKNSQNKGRKKKHGR